MKNDKNKLLLFYKICAKNCATIPQMTRIGLAHKDKKSDVFKYI